MVTLLKDKTADSVLEACKRTHAIITKRAGSTLRTWQFDRDSKFCNKKFGEWIHQELGGKQLFSNVQHPWENGRAERSFQTLFSKARSVMHHADLPIRTWGKAILHAAYLKNRSPSTRIKGLSPLQFRTGEPLDYSKLRVFGCPAQIFVRPSERDDPKLGARSEHGTLVGMSSKGNGFIFYVPRNNTLTEVDSKDKGIIVDKGISLQLDLGESQDSEYVHVDGRVVIPQSHLQWLPLIALTL